MVGIESEKMAFGTPNLQVFLSGSAQLKTVKMAKKIKNTEGVFFEKKF